MSYMYQQHEADFPKSKRLPLPWRGISGSAITGEIIRTWDAALFALRRSKITTSASIVSLGSGVGARPRRGGSSRAGHRWALSVGRSGHGAPVTTGHRRGGDTGRRHWAGAGDRAGAGDAADDVLFVLVVGFAFGDHTLAGSALRGIALQADAVAILGVDSVFTTKGVIAFVAAEALRMVYLAFSVELAALNRHVASITDGRRAGHALDLAGVNLVLHVPDRLVAGFAGEALMMKRLSVRGNISSVHGQIEIAFSALHSSRDTRLANVSVDLANRFGVDDLLRGNDRNVHGLGCRLGSNFARGSLIDERLGRGLVLGVSHVVDFWFLILTGHHDFIWLASCYLLFR